MRLLDKRLPETLYDLMKTHHIPVEKICFILTDITMIDDSPIIEENIRKIHDIGFRFALRSFGKNFIDLTSLVTLPLVGIKLDKSVLEVASKDERGKNMLYSALQMIRALGMKSACDGVAAKEQDDILQSAPCDFAQGCYYYGILDEDAYVDILQKQLYSTLTDINNG